jgi:hypothetical protein
MQYVIIKPKELYNRLKTLHKGVKYLQIYLWVTASKKYWEARGLKKKEHDDIVSDTYKNQTRDFTYFLNNWNPIINKLT